LFARVSAPKTIYSSTLSLPQPSRFSDLINNTDDKRLFNMKPLTLHAHNTGPNPYKVAIVLEALKLPYEVKIWEFGDGENGVKGPVFTKINENGRVPALGKSLPSQCWPQPFPSPSSAPYR